MRCMGGVGKSTSCKGSGRRVFNSLLAELSEDQHSMQLASTAAGYRHPKGFRFLAPGKVALNISGRLAPEYGKRISADIYQLAKDSKKIIQSKNMRHQINTADLDLKYLSQRGGNYNIDGDVNL